MTFRSLLFASLFSTSTGCDFFKSADDDDDDDWDTAGWNDDGWGEEGGDETGGDETGGDETGGGDTEGETTGGETGGDVTGGEETGGDSLDASCSFSADICIEANEADNETWCTDNGGTPSDVVCADGADGTCAIPAGGAYSADATGYYYNGFDGETACTDAGGTYTAAWGGSDDDDEDTGEVEDPDTGW